MTERELLELLVQKVTGIESKVTTIENEVASIKSDVPILKREMNQVMQADIETNEIVRHIKSTQGKTESEINNHSYSIDVLNREQFHLKSEIEKLKNR